MRKIASSSRTAALALMLGCGALAAGCALIYNFGDYAENSTASGTGGTASGTGGAGVGGGMVSTSVTGTGGAATVGKVAWARRIGGGGIDRTGQPGLAISPSGEIFITGTFQGVLDIDGTVLNSNNLGILLAKLDPTTGKAKWARSIGDTTSEIPAIAATADGGVIITGSFDQATTLDTTPKVTSGVHDIFLAKYDSQGKYLWGKTYGDALEQYAKAVAVDATGKTYVTGQFAGGLDFGAPCSSLLTPGAPLGFVAAFNGGTGECVWAEQFGTVVNASDHFDGHALAANASGVVLGGSFSGSMTLLGAPSLFTMASDAAFVAKIDLAKQPLFVANLPGATDVHVAIDPATGETFYTATMHVGIMETDIVFGKFNEKGVNSVLLNPAKPGAKNHPMSIAPGPSGDFFLAGWSMAPFDFGKPIGNNGSLDAFLGRVNASGVPLDGIAFSDMEAQIGRNVRVGGDRSVYLFGDFQGTVDFGKGPLMAMGGYEMFLVRFAP